MLTLIQSDNCQLCDSAWEILAQTGVLEFESIFIDDDTALRARYGARVPVVRVGAAELDWPFSSTQLRVWLVGLGLI